MISREHETLKLSSIFKINSFYDSQWTVINELLKKRRILMIEKTGFGKSLCYQYPATQFSGLTIVFTPLVALMRDQVKHLQSLGINAECIYHERLKETKDQDINNKILKNAKDGKYKILYISPERQENVDWLSNVNFLNLSMVVVDEAHCISTWGHNFRPSYKRIANLVKQLPQNFPILATTATATKRTTDDIITQTGSSLKVLRGKLLRENFHLNVVNVNSEDEKLSWLKHFLTSEHSLEIIRNSKKGTGVIYAGTRTQAEWINSWLHYCGISSVFYHAGLEADSRIEVEKGLLENKWRVVVSTNALGMGIDKPDISFIVHTQMPQSLIHYYQEIGRAGRDNREVGIFLLFNKNNDLSLPESFVRNNRPSEDKYNIVINALRSEPDSMWPLMKKTNLKQTVLRTILADLENQKIIRTVIYGRKKLYELSKKDTSIDFKPFEELRVFETKELKSIVSYSSKSFESCRMVEICNYLGDEMSSNCDKCDNCIDRRFINHFSICDNQILSMIEDFKDNYYPTIEFKSKNESFIEGVASSYYGISNIGSIIRKCKYEQGGDFPNILIKKTLKAFNYKFKKINFDMIIYVPPTKSGNLVKNFAHKISEILNIPCTNSVIKNRVSDEQKNLNNWLLKKENVKDLFSISDDIILENKNILLIDDIYDSGYTLTSIANLLIQKKAKLIAPLTIAKCVSGDI